MYTFTNISDVMSNIELFNFEGNEVRTVIMNDDIWFVGKDVCNILGYSNPRDAIRNHVFDDDKGGRNYRHPWW